MKSEIFPGDSLSPLIHCISLIPPIEQLYKLNTGHEDQTTKTKVSRLFYMDDLKLIDKTEELQTQMLAIRTINYDIHVEFGPEKSAKFVLKTGKLVHS
jgi:hypothetical protein